MALVRVCDMHDLAEWWVEVEATRHFTLDGDSYEIDLCGDHDAQLAESLGEFIRHARAGQRGTRRK
jgi:hypothetical protein